MVENPTVSLPFNVVWAISVASRVQALFGTPFIDTRTPLFGTLQDISISNKRCLIRHSIISPN